MWHNFSILAIAMALLGVAAAQSPRSTPKPTPSPSVSILLNTDTPYIKIGSELWIDAVTTNISDHRVGIGFLPGPYESDQFTVTVQVRDTDDRPVGPEELDRHACAGKPNCIVKDEESRYLVPGESAKDHFLIGKKYDLSRPGNYTIQIVRRDKRTHEISESNVLLISVIE